MKGQIESFENVALKSHLRRQMDEDRKNFSLNQRVSDPLEFVTSRNNNSQSREFIDRFKGVDLLPRAKNTRNFRLLIN